MGWVGRLLAVLACGLLVSFVPARADGYSAFNAGLAARNSGDCPGSVTQLTTALNSPDLLPDLRRVAYFIRAECRDFDRESALAIQDLNESLKLDPDFYDAHFLRGRGFMKLKRYAEAEADFRELERIRPDLTRGYIALSLLYVEQKQFDQALAQMTALIGTHANDLVGYSLRARLEIKAGALDKAFDDADKLVDISDESVESLMLRSWIYDLKGDYRRALSDVDDVLEKRQADIEAMRSKGLLLWKMKRFDESFAQFAQIDPKDGYGDLWFKIARLAAGQDDGEFATRAGRADASKWPAPLLRLFLGKSTPEDVERSVTADGDKNSERDVCEAAFYVGEWQLQQAMPDAARPLLEKAASVCPVEYVERNAAEVELSRMKP